MRLTPNPPKEQLRKRQAVRSNEASNARVIPQFRHVKRYWDPSRKIHVAQICPGEVYVTKQHELISTLLGSCIAVCMRDKRGTVGGMNHFKLPHSNPTKADTVDTNYGIHAMELLINEILKNGGQRPFLECEIFGGGSVVAGLSSSIGDKNIEFVNSFLRQERILIRRQDTGKRGAQQVYYHPISGNTFSVEKQDMTQEKLKKAEELYLKKVNIEMDDDDSGITYF